MACDYLYFTDLKLVGGAIGTHKEYRFMCCLDFAGGVINFEDLIRHDVCYVLKKGERVEGDFVKAIKSIIGADPDVLFETILLQLSEGAEVTLDYLYTKHTATLTFKKTIDLETSIRKTTISW